MKKVILTEEQANNLMKKIINERFGTDDQNYIDVICDFDYHRVTYKGSEIVNVNQINLTITYAIDVEYRTYGIKGISVYNISGPKQIDVELYYQLPNNGEIEEDMITIPLDWDKDININEDETLGYYGISNDMSITLGNDDEGNVIVESINLNVKNF